MITPGVSVTEGQPVIELETDKAVVEVPSSVTGTVKDIRVKEGEKVKVGQVIFTVENGAGGARTAAPPKQTEPALKPTAPAPASTPSAPPKASAPAPTPTSPTTSVGPSEFRLPELGE